MSQKPSTFLIRSFLRALYLLGLIGVPAAAQLLPIIGLDESFPGVTFKQPVRMEEAPDETGRFFVAEQDGRIMMIRNGAPEAAEMLNIENRKPHASLEEGLLGLAFHPRFKSNQLFYICYTQADPRRTVISEFKMSADNPDRADMKSERVVLEVPQPFENHKAGQVSFGPDGFLYIGLGDGGRGNDPFNNAQNTAVLLGKILRIDVNTRSTNHSQGRSEVLQYGIPGDNPFAAEPELYEYGVRKEIWAYGFRNPWRFSWDRETGEMWAGDVGQDKWEEVNLVVKGGNYGWCVREGAHHFKPGPDGARYIDPVMEYPHDPKLLAQSAFPDHGIGCCVIGGYAYRGKKYPPLQGVYLYADYVLGTIWGLRSENGKITSSGTLLEQPKNITSFAEDRQGELYTLTYDGHIYSVTVPNVGQPRFSMAR